MEYNLLKIKKLIEKRGLKNNFIISKLNLAESTFYSYLSGKTDLPMSIFLELLKILNDNPSDFFNNENDVVVDKKTLTELFNWSLNDVLSLDEELNKKWEELTEEYIDQDEDKYNEKGNRKIATYLLKRFDKIIATEDDFLIGVEKNGGLTVLYDAPDSKLWADAQPDMNEEDIKHFMNTNRKTEPKKDNDYKEKFIESLENERELQKTIIDNLKNEIEDLKNNSSIVQRTVLKQKNQKL